MYSHTFIIIWQREKLPDLISFAVNHSMMFVDNRGQLLMYSHCLMAVLSTEKPNTIERSVLPSALSREICQLASSLPYINPIRCCKLEELSVLPGLILVRKHTEKGHSHVAHTWCTGSSYQRAVFMLLCGGCQFITQGLTRVSPIWQR